MAKKKFIYNPETLDFEKVQKSFQSRLFNFIGFLFSSILMAAVMTYLGYSFFDLPKERVLKGRIGNLSEKYDSLNQRVELLDSLVTIFEERDNNVYRVIFETPPLTERNIDLSKYDLTKLDDVNYYSLYETIEQKVDNILHRTYKQSLSYDTLYQIAQRRRSFLSSIPSIAPLDLRQLRTRLSSGFGFRIHPIYKTRRKHEGIDIAAPRGTPVYAVGDGTIVKAGVQGGYGRTIMIDHGFGYKTLYGHLQAYKVRKWQKIKRGQIIGLVGNTGMSTAPHLHYEVIKGGRPVNPINYFYADLTTEEYEDILKLSEEVNQSLD